MKIVLDQLHRPVEINQPLNRIVSLVPSLTELLFDMGLGDKVVGRTKFCIHPEDSIHDVTIIGGTKNLHFDKIYKLQPDLIIANKEENNQEHIEMLEERISVYVSDVPDLARSFELIRLFGSLFDIAGTAENIILKSKESIEKLKSKQSKKAIYLIWQNPFMTIGGDTYINSMMENLGYTNLFSDGIRYPQITIQEMQQLNPDKILLSSEPFPFNEKHVLALQENFPNIKIELVDGELFSWYGSRLIHK